MMDERINRLVKPLVRESSAYQVQDSAGMIKLDAMENPFSWPGKLRQGWLERLADIQVNRYPDAEGTALKRLLREVYAIPDTQEILLGNGSDEIIQMICLALDGSPVVILAPEPTFAMYSVIAGFTGARYAGVPLRHDFSLDRDAMLQAIDRYQPTVIFLACPNNPTSNLFSDDVITEILNHAPGLVVIDEAYHEFAGTSHLGKLESFPNLLVMRTLSKLGLAGLRLGFMVGEGDWIKELNKVRLPYNINVLTQRSAEFALEHMQILVDQANRICRYRQELYTILDAMDFIQVWPSATNFLLFRPETEDSDKVFAGLKQHGILIKNLSGVHPLLAGCLRVTVGSEPDNAAFIAALRALL